MLATQIRQKDSVFYFCAYPADDLLDKVRFIHRFYAEGAPSLAGEEVDAGDEVAQFISRIESTDAAFQRERSRGKVTAIKNFYETAVRTERVYEEMKGELGLDHFEGRS